ncbi:substrate-binding domain-containing protein [Bradyrhizobium sp. Gha]|uniref:sugar ABC transporter substrate-binding protein n=1 Tax=Bradyrhizobium sp. Gha TaxID=1855318 RepID=UPI0008DEC1E1|nr:substrate-binding domain-containing protein [Bradyrhizobium sp. Gha]SFJ82079.1 D-xylose transport system substrate-binding protein [Bradyrhizobium sp. Gha]
MRDLLGLTKQLVEGRVSRRELMKSAAMYGAATATLGAGGFSARAATGPLVGFSFPSFDAFRWPHDRHYFQTRADELGLRYIIQGANEDVATQDTQIDAMLSQGIKVLVIIPVNVEAAKKIVERVKREANIPIISYNYVIPSPAIDYWAARDNYLVGELQAKQALKEAKKGNWALVSGPEGIDVARQKTEGALRILKPYIDSGEIKIVSHQWHDNWRQESALKQIEDALTKNNNNIQAVVSNEEGLALGALQALTEQRLNGKVWLCGEDVWPEGARAIVRGDMAMSAWTDLIQMGRVTAEAALALTRGEVPKTNETLDVGSKKIPGMRIQSRVVNKETLPDFLKLTDWLKPEDIGLKAG